MRNMKQHPDALWTVYKRKKDKENSGEAYRMDG